MFCIFFKLCYDGSMETKFRIMCLDYGTVRIGIALSDLTQTLASGYATYTCKSYKQDVEYLKKVISENDVKKIVFGLPLNMDGTESSQTLKTKNFANILRQNLDESIEIVFADERMTSLIAEKMLLSADVSRQKRKMVIDKVSATIILQDYLDYKRSI